MIAEGYEGYEKKTIENNKFSNSTNSRKELNFSLNSKKGYSHDDNNIYTKQNKLRNSNNSFSLEQDKKAGYINNSFQSDSSIKYNIATSTTSSLVDKDFISCTPVKKQPFDPNNFINTKKNGSFYINSDSILKSDDVSIFSENLINENNNKRYTKKTFDNSEYIRKIEEENNKLELELNKLKDELNKTNNELIKKNNDFEKLEKSNKSNLEVLNNEIEKKGKIIKQLKEKNDSLSNEIKEKNLEIDEYKSSNKSMKKEINKYKTKIKSSIVTINNLKEENQSITEENINLKEQLDMLSDISIEKQKLEDENEHLRMIAEEIDLENEEIDIMKNEYHGKPTLMDEIQSENSSSDHDHDRNQLENTLKSKLRTYQFENRDLKEKVKSLENQLKGFIEKEEKEKDNIKEINTYENIEEIIKKVKKETQLEIIQKYDDKEKQDLIQEIERQNEVINNLNYKEQEILKESNEKITKLAIDKIPLLSVVFKHKIQFSLLLLLAWLFGVMICFIVIEYVVYLAGDYGTCHHLTNQFFFPQALMQALSANANAPL